MGDRITQGPEKAHITLRDIDNRDGDEPYQFTGTTEEVCGYIDGPLRRDLTEPHDDDLADAMDAVRRGDIEAANHVLNHMSVYLSEERHRG